MPISSIAFNVHFTCKYIHTFKFYYGEPEGWHPYLDKCSQMAKGATHIWPEITHSFFQKKKFTIILRQLCLFIYFY